MDHGAVKEMAECWPPESGSWETHTSSTHDRSSVRPPAGTTRARLARGHSPVLEEEDLTTDLGNAVEDNVLLADLRSDGPQRGGGASASVHICIRGGSWGRTPGFRLSPTSGLYPVRLSAGPMLTISLTAVDHVHFTGEEAEAQRGQISPECRFLCPQGLMCRPITKVNNVSGLIPLLMVASGITASTRTWRIPSVSCSLWAGVPALEPGTSFLQMSGSCSTPGFPKLIHSGTTCPLLA